MTTLDNGIVIDESIDAAHLTRAADCPAVFGQARNVSGVTVHHWGDDGQNFDTVVAYLASDNARESSAHFVVQDGRVTCLVSPDDAAWHAGNATGNCITVGIEMRPECTPGDLAALESLIRYLQTIYGDLAVYKHDDWINTACPGRYGALVDQIVAGVNAGAPAPIVTAPAPTPAPAGSHHHCCCND